MKIKNNSNYWEKNFDNLLQMNKKKGSPEYLRNEYVLNFIKKNKIRSFHDIGCGTGELVRKVDKQKIVKKIIASDFYIDELRLKTSRNKNIKYYNQNISNSPKLNKFSKVDLCTAMSVLPYIKSYKKFFKNYLNEYLKKKKYFIFSFPNELFDIYTLNTNTKDFYLKYLVQNKKFKKKEYLKLSQFLSSKFDKKINLNNKKISGYKDKQIKHFHRINYFLISKFLKDNGYEIIDVNFLNHHEFPTSFDLYNKNKFKKKKIINLNEKNGWSGLFTCSTIMITIRI